MPGGSTGVVSWESSALGAILCYFVRKHAIPHPLPNMPKIRIVENQHLLFDDSVP